MQNKKAVVIGSGNIGRGLNAFILNENKYDITFMDVSQDVVVQLNETDSYSIFEKSDAGNEYTVSNFKAVNILEQKETAAQEIANTDVVFISIGINNLAKLKDLFVDAISAKIKDNNTNFLNIVAVENGLNATTVLSDVVLSGMDKTQMQFIDSYIGFPNCAVDRIIPNGNDDSLNVNVEKFFELVIDKESWKGDHLDKVVYSEDLNKFLIRKLVMLNATHSYIAWSGIKDNFINTNEFVKNNFVSSSVVELLDEFVHILSTEFDFTKSELIEYKEKILSRMKNKHINDNVKRVGREVIRKISKGDRLSIPLELAMKHDLKHEMIIKTFSLAYSSLDIGDDESDELNKYIKDNGVEKAITKYSQIADENIIMKIYENI